VTTPVVPLKNVLELHALQEEIVKHISSNTAFYLKIDDSGPEKSVKLVTGFRADISNFFGSSKFDLEKVLSVFEAQLKKAREEIDSYNKTSPPNAIYKELINYQYALTMVVDLIAFKYTEWNLKNHRPKGEKSLEDRAMALRDAFFVRMKFEVPETPVSMPPKEIVIETEETQARAIATKQLATPIPVIEMPLAQSIKPIQTESPSPPAIVKDPDLDALGKLQPDLLNPLWAHKKSKDKPLGWEFRDVEVIFREETIGGEIKEEHFRATDDVFKKMKLSLQVAAIDFQEAVLSSLDRVEVDPVSAILRQDLKDEFERLKGDLIRVDTKTAFIEHSEKFANFMKIAKVLLDMHGIALNGRIQLPTKDSAKRHKKEKSAQIPFLILQLKTVTKLAFFHYSRVGPPEKKEVIKDLARKIVQLFNDTPSGFHKKGYIKCLELVQELQNLGLSWEKWELKVEGGNLQVPSSNELFKDYLSELYLNGLKLLLDLDKSSRARSHFLNSDRGMPARMVYDRLLESFTEGTFSETDIKTCKILIDAFLAKPSEKESWNGFLQLEFAEFRSIIDHFSRLHVKENERIALSRKLAKIPPEPTLQNLNALYEAVRGYQTLWDKHHEALEVATLNKLKTGLERDLLQVAEL